MISVSVEEVAIVIEDGVGDENWRVQVKTRYVQTVAASNLLFIGINPKENLMSS